MCAPSVLYIHRTYFAAQSASVRTTSAHMPISNSFNGASALVRENFHSLTDAGSAHRIQNELQSSALFCATENHKAEMFSEGGAIYISYFMAVVMLRTMIICVCVRVRPLKGEHRRREKPSGVLHAGKHVVCVAFTFTQSLRRHGTHWLSNDVVDAESASGSAARGDGLAVIPRSGELVSFWYFLHFLFLS